LKVLGGGIVALIGKTPQGNAGIAVAVSKDRQEAGASAAELGLPAAKALGGGGGKNPDLFIGQGKQVDKIDEAIQLVRERAVVWRR